MSGMIPKSGSWAIDHESRDPKHPHHFFIRVGGPVSAYSSVSGHIGHANARLIEAAPDLHAALSALVAKSTDTDSDWSAEWKAALDALAKAGLDQ